MLKFGSRSDINACYKCTIRLLDDSEILESEFFVNEKGRHLIERICNQLNLVEMDYFGIRYVDSSHQRHWLDPAKSVLKQVKDMDPILFSFRFKFYPPDPFKLKEEITRYQLYLQLKRDLLHGRLYCNSLDSALLAAYIVQAELGDYNEEEHVENYLGETKLLLKQTPFIEDKIMEFHQTELKGQDPTTAESNFLRKAAALDTYGADPHPVKDHKGNQLYLGIKHCGILTFQGSQKTHHFNWNEMHKLNFEGKMFIIHLHYHEKKHTVGFKCPSGAACRHIWRCAIEQMLFFTLPSSAAIPPVVSGGGLFSFGAKIRYSGRVEKELHEDRGAERREEPNVQRVGSMRRKAASVPATPSTPVVSELGYKGLHRSNLSADCQLDLASRCGHLASGGLDLDDLEPVSEDTESKDLAAHYGDLRTMLTLLCWLALMGQAACSPRQPGLRQFVTSTRREGREIVIDPEPLSEAEDGTPSPTFRPFSQEELDKYLRDYTATNGPSSSQAPAKSEEKSWHLIKSQTHKHPFDDRAGWVTLEPVPWSASQIQKWEPNTKPIPQWEEPWGKPQRPRPWTGGPSHKPTYEYRPESQPSKPWESGSDIITDGRPGGFPGAQDPWPSRPVGGGYPGHKESHHSSHPSEGDGQWVLLSTTKGYSYPHRNKYQRAINFTKGTPSISSHRTVRLTVLPAENTTTSHGGLLEVEKTAQSVDEAQREHAAKMLRFPSPSNEVESKTPRRRVGIHIYPGKYLGIRDNNAVLAAVGAGMIPATVAMLLPMVAGRRKRSPSSTSYKVPAFLS